MARYDCGSEYTVQNGKVRLKSYRCKTCDFNFVLGFSARKDFSRSKLFVILLYGRASYGFIARLLKVSSVAVMKWIKREADLLPDPIVSSYIQEVSFDEMWYFVNKKEKLWVWRAVECVRNSTIGWCVGDRSTATFRKFFKKFGLIPKSSKTKKGHCIFVTMPLLN